MSPRPSFLFKGRGNVKYLPAMWPSVLLAEFSAAAFYKIMVLLILTI